jgi:transcriptional pleiotropic regulator of transition state genes
MRRKYVLPIARSKRHETPSLGAIMHDTGIVRRVDDLGRIVIPIELRRTLGINVKDPVAIYTEGDRIILQKHKGICTICGAADVPMTEVKNRSVCAGCIKAIKKT